MTLQGHLAADWLTDPALRMIMEALDSAGQGESRFVGGCVRNTLMGRPVDDVDIATQIVPDGVMAAMKKAGIRVIPTGVEHGTLTAIADHRPFEITTLRRDVVTDGRRAVIAFTRNWTEDAQRRDFRLNAIYCDADGRIHEFVEGCIADALAGRVIFIGDPDARLREDYLRILRFFRFNAWYGAQMDETGLAACTRLREGLGKIAPERLWKELKKTLSAPEPSSAMVAMEASGVLAQVAGDGLTTAKLARLAALEGDLGLPPDPLRRLMAMLPQEPAACRALAVRLRLSNEERDRLTAWAEIPCVSARVMPTGQELRKLLYNFGVSAVEDCLIVGQISGQNTPSNTMREAVALINDWVRPQFPLDGRDMLAAGLSGTRVGVVLKAIESEWIDSGFTLTRDSLLSRLKALASKP